PVACRLAEYSVSFPAPGRNMDRPVEQGQTRFTEALHQVEVFHQSQRRKAPDLVEDFAPHEDPLVAVRQPPPLHPQRVPPLEPAKSKAIGVDSLPETAADAQRVVHGGGNLLETTRLEPAVSVEKEENVSRAGGSPGVLLGGPATEGRQDMV